MTLVDSDDNVIIRSVPLVPFYPLIGGYSLKKPKGEFLLVPFDQTALQEDIPNPRQVYDTHFLFYTDELE